MEYSEVKEQIKQKLPVQKEFGDSENLLELGLSSIVIMRLVNQWRKQGVKVAFGTLMEHPTLKEWWKIIQKGTKKKGKKAKAEKRDIIMERDMRKPFPLTDVQYAWHDVEQILRKNGKKVTSVLLPGHNETDIERLKDINVTTCVESIINQIGETDEKLTLVFHSMAGIFIYDTYKKIGKEQIESIYCVACCIPAAGETMSDILKGPLHSFASFCAGKIQVVKRFPKILALAIFGNGMNKKQREKLYSSLCGESTNLLFERINECKLETSIKWILPTKDRALNPKQQRVYMNNIGNIKSIIKLTAPHDVMISHPEEVAKILLEN